jgi:hypothetical protein
MFSTIGTHHRTRRLLAAGVAAAGLLAATSGAQADEPVNRTAASSVALGDAQLAGHIEAGSGGRVAYYSFAYPGEGAMINIQLQNTGGEGVPESSASSPSMPGAQGDPNWGFNLLGPSGSRVAGGAPNGSEIPNAAVTLGEGAIGTYVVEVYQLDPATQLNFALTKTVLVSSRDQNDRSDGGGSGGDGGSGDPTAAPSSVGEEGG